MAKHASLVFGGVPVLYTPWADFPINGNRKSGLLVPTIATGSDGLELSLPYYFNLAPNWMPPSARASSANAACNWAAKCVICNRITAAKSMAIGCRTTKKASTTTATSSNGNTRQQLNSKISGGINYNQVSDDDYYRDFYGREDIARNVNLDRQAWLNYSDKLLGAASTARCAYKK